MSKVVLEKKIVDKVRELLMYSDYWSGVVSSEPRDIVYDVDGKVSVVFWSDTSSDVVVTKSSLTLTDNRNCKSKTVTSYENFEELLDTSVLAIVEFIRDEARDILSSSSNSTERRNAGIELIRGYYGRAKFLRKREMKNISFDKYAAMFLKSCRDNVFAGFEDVADELVKLFGLSDGLKIGKTYVFE